MTDPIDTAATPATAPQDDKNATAPAATTEPVKTIVASGGDDTATVAANEKPAEDWRVRLAAGDEKELKRLSRYASEADLYKAYRELEKKKSSGELKAALPKDATPEEVADWRKSNGIPEAPDKYDLSFDNGLVIGEEDKPLIDKFVANMHGENATPAQVKAAISSYYALIGEQQQVRAENDVAFKDETLEGLREEWQGDYKKNLAVIDLFLDTLPQDTRLAFENARTAEGNLIGNDPAIIRWLAETAYKINPAASVMPNSVSNPGAAIGDEIAALEKLIGDRDSDYWKGPNAAKNQSRYLSLIDARDKIAARG